MQLKRPWKEYIMALKKELLDQWKVKVFALITLGWVWYVTSPDNIWIGVAVMTFATLYADTKRALGRVSPESARVMEAIAVFVIWIALGAELAEHMIDDARWTSAPTVFMIGFFVLFSGFAVWIVFETWKEYQKSKRYR